MFGLRKRSTLIGFTPLLTLIEYGSTFKDFISFKDVAKTDLCFLKTDLIVSWDSTLKAGFMSHSISST